MGEPAGDETGTAEAVSSSSSGGAQMSPLRRGKRSKAAAAAATAGTTASTRSKQGEATEKATEANESAMKAEDPPPAADKGGKAPESDGKAPPPPAAAATAFGGSAATTSAYAAAAAALPPQALYGYNPPGGGGGTAPAPSSSGGGGVVYNETNVFASSVPETKPLTAAMRAALELESKGRVVFDESGNVNVTLKLPRRKSGDAAPESAAAATTIPLGDESSLVVAAAAAAIASSGSTQPSMSAADDIAINPTASMGSMQSTLNLVHSQNPGLLKAHQAQLGDTNGSSNPSGSSNMIAMMQRYGIGGFGSSGIGGVQGILGSAGDGIAGTAAGAGEDGQLASTQSLRVLKRLVPREAEMALRGQVVSEFAHVLQPDECLEENQQLGVSSQSAKFNRVFEDRFFELLVFSKAYGHMHVPKLYPDNPPLGRWVVKVRSWRKKNDPRLTPSRVNRLNQVGFIWEPKNHQDFWKVQGSNKKAEDLWETNFAELLQYRDEHGDCLVPKEFPPNQRLARWVTKQRKHYKAKQEGRYHSLDDEKERRLLEVGFVFNTKTKELMRDSVLRRYEDRWEEFCEKLQEFRKEFGHAAVPRRWKRDPQLASWVMRQRFQWRKMQTGEHSYLTKARLERLESIGFVFGEIDRKIYPVGKMEEGEDDSVANEDALDEVEIEGSEGEGEDGDKKPAAALAWAVEKSAKVAKKDSGSKRPPKRPMTKAKPSIKGKGTLERTTPGRKASGKRSRNNDDERTESEPSGGEDDGAKKPVAKKKKASQPSADEGPEAKGPEKSEGEGVAKADASVGEAASSEEAIALEPTQKVEAGTKAKPAGGKKAAVKLSLKELPASASDAGSGAGGPSETTETLPVLASLPEEDNSATFVATSYQEAVSKGMESIAIAAIDDLE